MYYSKRAKHTRSMNIAKIQKRFISFTVVTGTDALCVTTNSRFNQYNMKYLRKRTTTIDEVLRASGYNVVAIWEHEFDKNKET